MNPRQFRVYDKSVKRWLDITHLLLHENRPIGATDTDGITHNLSSPYIELVESIDTPDKDGNTLFLGDIVEANTKKTLRYERVRGTLTRVQDIVVIMPAKPLTADNFYPLYYLDLGSLEKVGDQFSN